MTSHSPSPNPFTDQKPIANVKNVLVIASGKGGVGKSTVAINLAVALAKNHKVGLLDADVYGPSIPRMMGASGQRPVTDESGRIVPLERYGVKLMSIGFLIDDSTSVVWRGPMLFKAMDQFINDVQWGDLDYLIIDLPPGTGDVQLTLAQKIPITAAIIVSTPQNISLIDAKRAVDMFERTQVPILGLIENMAYLSHPQTNERIQLYPKGELDDYLASKDILKLGILPFNQKISLSCEIGIPVMSLAHENAPQTEVTEFDDICEHIEALLEVASPTFSLANQKQAAKQPSSITRVGCSGNCTCQPQA